jgi:hypothetical protein
MRSKPEIFVLQAAECRRKAAVATDRTLKWLFSDLAVQWLDLAATARYLKPTKRSGSIFLGGSPPSGRQAPRGGGESGKVAVEKVSRHALIAMDEVEQLRLPA